MRIAVNTILKGKGSMFKVTSVAVEQDPVESTFDTVLSLKCMDDDNRTISQSKLSTIANGILKGDIEIHI